MYEIIVSKKAEKILDKLNSKDRERIILALRKLKIRPQAYLIRLVGEKSYKFRVGNYRLIIDLNNNQLQVLVIKIGHRKNIYKK
jgi:mRNA interferase RelE/StbE